MKNLKEVKMKKLFSVLVLFVFLFSIVPVIAQENTETTSTTAENINEVADISEEDAGIAPDSPMYGLKIALERIRLGLTFNRTEKTEIGLKMAERRLIEAQLMAKKGKINALEKAKNEHGRFLGIIKRNIELIDDDPEKALEEETKIDESIEGQQEIINRMALLISGLTDGQKERLKALIDEFRNETDDVKARIITKKDFAKIKLKAKLNLTEERAEEKINEIENRVVKNVDKIAEKQVDQAEKMLDLAEEQIKKAKEKNVAIKEITITLKEKASNTLNEAKTALENKRYKLAVVLARESKRLSALTIASIHGKEASKEKIESALEKREEQIEKVKEKLKKRQDIVEKIREKVKEKSEED